MKKLICGLCMILFVVLLGSIGFFSKWKVMRLTDKLLQENTDPVFEVKVPDEDFIYVHEILEESLERKNSKDILEESPYSFTSNDNLGHYFMEGKTSKMDLFKHIYKDKYIITDFKIFYEDKDLNGNYKVLDDQEYKGHYIIIYNIDTDEYSLYKRRNTIKEFI